MTTRTFRITVRGVFAGLSPEQRAALLAEAAEHDIFGAAFTAEGHLSYDIAARPVATSPRPSGPGRVRRASSVTAASSPNATMGGST